jgi:hypothetical protein
VSDAPPQTGPYHMLTRRILYFFDASMILP